MLAGARANRNIRGWMLFAQFFENSRQLVRKDHRQHYHPQAPAFGAGEFCDLIERRVVLSQI